jgi:olefin beta-lactone synthetase
MSQSPANIVQVFIEAAARHGDAVAFLHEKGAVSYTELLIQVKKTADGFLRDGIKKGDRALVFVPMSIDLYRIVLGLLYIGAVPVFLDEWVSRERLKACCSVVPCQALIADRKLLIASVFIRELRNIPIKILPGTGSVHESKNPPIQVNDDETALITFTTGSSGIPKAADRTHRFLYAQLQALKPLIDNDHHPCLTLLPIVVLLNLALGRTTLLPPRRFKIKKTSTFVLIADHIRQFRPAGIIASPSLVADIAQRMSGEDLSYVKQVITGGGPVFPDAAAVISKTFAAAEIKVVFGSTEAEPMSVIDGKEVADVNRQDILENGLPVGVPETRLFIIPFKDEPLPALSIQDLEALKLPGGEGGEIIVYGEHVLKSYINNEEVVKRQKISVGNEIWHRTGDMGRLGEDGRLFFLGRCHELIIRAGRAIYPLITCWRFTAETGIPSALVRRGEDLILLLEADPRQASIPTQILQDLGLEDVVIRFIDQIPRDPRHRTKVDYEKIHDWLDRHP